MTGKIAPTLRVDFNRADDDEIVWAYRDRSNKPDGFTVGEFIELCDYEGNRCLGSVVEIDGEIVRVKLELTTWMDADPIRSIQAQPDARLEDVLLRAIAYAPVQLNTE
jgi:hypothetical protein